MIPDTALDARDAPRKASHSASVGRSDGEAAHAAFEAPLRSTSDLSSLSHEGGYTLDRGAWPVLLANAMFGFGTW